MSDDLRPCPFCGKEMWRQARDETREHFVWCGNCGAFGPNDITAEHAGRMWNLRRPEDALRAELERAQSLVIGADERVSGSRHVDGDGMTAYGKAAASLLNGIDQVKRENAQLREGLEHGARENERLRIQVADLYGSLGSWYVDVVDNEERENERLRIEDLFYMLTVGESEGLPHIGDTVYVFDGNTEMRELVYNGEHFEKFERWILVKPAGVNDGNNDGDDAE